MTIPAIPVAFPTSDLFRVCRLGRDPFAPPPWGLADKGRYDDPHIDKVGFQHAEAHGCFRMIYLADSRVVAFREVLQNFRPRPELIASIMAETSDADLAAVTRDLEGGYAIHDGHVRGVVHREWRLARGIAQISVEGRACADLTLPAAWSYLNRVPEINQIAINLKIGPIDLSSLTSGHRLLTQAIARHIHESVDENGSRRYGGIRFPSRFGSVGHSICWAMFHDSFPRSPPGQPLSIAEGDVDLHHVAHDFDLAVVADDGRMLIP